MRGRYDKNNGDPRESGESPEAFNQRDETPKAFATPSVRMSNAPTFVSCDNNLGDSFKSTAAAFACMNVFPRNYAHLSVCIYLSQKFICLYDDDNLHCFKWNAL